MTNHAEIDFVIRNFMNWAAEARKDHADLLETSSDLFAEHGFAPYSGVIVDAISDMEGTLCSQAQDRMNLNPEDEIDEVSQVISKWSRATISEGGHDLMVLAAIYGIGADRLESALESCTPETPSY
ncbi:hypothetical protein G6L37_01160 [Agrobacterium rubi]|nr:hypothetical protein [Agrobacterium rubi]NTF24000.1 hypothetical protein [Agrobacterium rubi]